MRPLNNNSKDKNKDKDKNLEKNDNRENKWSGSVKTEKVAWKQALNKKILNGAYCNLEKTLVLIRKVGQ